jgi:hypothetical protein
MGNEFWFHVAVIGGGMVSTAFVIAVLFLLGRLQIKGFAVDWIERVFLAIAVAGSVGCTLILLL